MTTNLNLLDHWAQIMTYMGNSATYRVVKEELDDFGQIVNSSYSDTEIEAAISPVSQRSLLEAPGMFHPGDLCMYAYASLNIMGSSQSATNENTQGRIIYEGVEYRIEKITTAYDNGVAVVDKFRLSKVAS